MARDFNGSTDRIDYSNVVAPTAASYTFSCMIKFDSVSSANSDYIFNVNDGSGTRTFTIGRISGSTGVLFSQVIWTSNNTNRQTPASTVTTGVWYNLVCTGTTSGTSSNHKIYLDGTQVDNTSIADGTGSVVAATGTWSLGGRTSDDVVNFDGQLEQCGFWTRVIDAWELQGLAKRYSPKFYRRGLVWAPDLDNIARDDVSNQAGTFDGTTRIDGGPKIVRPQSPRVARVSAAAPPGGNGAGPLVNGPILKSMLRGLAA